MAVEVFIHKMTEHMDRAVILGWRVKEGERVEQYQIILDVETEKAVVELEAPAAGILKGVRKGAVAGAEAPVGEPLAFIAAEDESVPTLPPLGASALAPVEQSALVLAAAAGDGAAEDDGAIRATPIARKVARDLKVDLGNVKGSGPRGRIREDDVRAYAASLASAATAPAAAAPIPAPAAPVPAAAAWLDLTTVQRLTGERMLESMRSAPQFALELSVDATNLLWMRDTTAGDAKISVTAFLVKAAAVVIAKHPRANAAFRDGKVQVSPAVNIGMAVGSENGLVVPVVHAAGQKTVGEIHQEIERFKEQAAAQRFNPADLEGGTFTISNLGMYGIERFNAILNPPQSAILAVGRIVKTPVALPDDSVGLRPLMRLTLTIDHRVMDGMQGAQFLSDLKHSLETLAFLV